MTNIIKVPIASPITVPHGPAAGKKVVPGITKAPQPTAQPNDSAHTAGIERYFVIPGFSLNFPNILIIGFSRH
jgi:hypothetical protein